MIDIGGSKSQTQIQIEDVNIEGLRDRELAIRQLEVTHSEHIDQEKKNDFKNQKYLSLSYKQ